MPRITSYPTITPTGSDLILLSDVSGTNNPTKTATASSIAELSVFEFTKVAATTAQLQGCFTTPITLIGNPGAGSVIVPISIVIDLTYGTAAMGGNTTLEVRSGANVLYSWTNALATGTDRINLMNNDPTAPARLLSATGLTLSLNTGDATLNGSTTTGNIHVYYRTLVL